jgi:hypothetical protein
MNPGERFVFHIEAFYRQSILARYVAIQHHSTSALSPKITSSNTSFLESLDVTVAVMVLSPYFHLPGGSWGGPASSYWQTQSKPI